MQGGKRHDALTNWMEKSMNKA